jgi:hypothetical protein
VEPPPLPKEEKAELIDAVIHIDDAQYYQLALALRPGVAPLLRDLPEDVPGSGVFVVADEASQPTPTSPSTAAPEQSSGTPIV